MLHNAILEMNRKTNRLMIILDTDEDVSRLRLRMDGVVQGGRFKETNWVGQVYQHIDGEWHLPGLGFGDWREAISFTTEAVTFSVGRPLSTIGTERLWPQELLLPYLWAAGFRTEQHLLWGLAIPMGESGYYTKARNWLPQDGFRDKPGIVIGVMGPAAAWNKLHTLQGHSDRGIFQWNSKAHPDISDADADDVGMACRWMFTKTGNATAEIWTPWGGGAGGEAYSPFFPELLPKVQAFLATK